MTKVKDLDESKSGVQVIARAAAILRALKNSRSGMSLGQIAARVDLPRSTVQRIVNALQAEQLVIAAADGRGLRLGPELNALAEATRSDIVEHCRPLLTELARTTGETADLAVLRGEAMIFLDQVLGRYRLRTVSKVGEAFPLTNSSNGRACLAKLPENQARKLVVAEWERQGIDGNLADFMTSISNIRETGLAYDLDEHTYGISAMGFAFADWSGDLHAISVPVPSTRFAQQRSDIERALLKTAKLLNTTMARSDC